MKIEEIYKSFENSSKQCIEITVNAQDAQGILCKVAKIKYNLNK